MKQPIIIGSRGSDLALWQAHFVQEQLHNLGVGSEIKIIKTQGDKIQHLGFDKMEGKGFFTKEIESALLTSEIDLAVHSHKDLETKSPEGLVIAAVSERANPNEYLLMHAHAHDPLQPLQLIKDAVVGTSAARRKAQLLAHRPDFKINDLRGNVPTRIDKLRRGDYDAILVARAGVDRLNIDLSEFVVEELDPRDFVPAPAQGALAFQVREDDHELHELLGKIDNRETATAIEAERSVLRLMDGGCQVPYGAFCAEENGRMQFWSFYADRGGTRPRRIYLESTVEGFDANKVLSQLRDVRGKKVLVTRNMNPDGLPAKMLTDAGCTVTDRSFIKISPEKPEKPDLPSFNWVFFTSPNAVAHFPFFDNVLAGTKWAVIGKGTRRALNEKQLDADFFGLGKPSDVGRIFREELGESRALIVCGKNGLRSIQKALDTDRFQSLEVYSTAPNPVVLEETFDIIAFTSPSNVKAFLAENKMAKSTKVVSIGESTARALHEHGIDCTVAWESSEQALADTVLGLT